MRLIASVKRLEIRIIEIEITNKRILFKSKARWQTIGKALVLSDFLKQYNCRQSAAMDTFIGILTSRWNGRLFIDKIFKCICFTSPVVEPLAVLTFAYTAYLVAELFHFSGIIGYVALILYLTWTYYDY